MDMIIKPTPAFVLEKEALIKAKISNAFRPVGFFSSGNSKLKLAEMESIKRPDINKTACELYFLTRK